MPLPSISIVAIVRPTNRFSGIGPLLSYQIGGTGAKEGKAGPQQKMAASVGIGRDQSGGKRLKRLLRHGTWYVVGLCPRRIAEQGRRSTSTEYSVRVRVPVYYSVLRPDSDDDHSKLHVKMDVCYKSSTSISHGCLPCWGIVVRAAKADTDTPPLGQGG